MISLYTPGVWGCLEVAYETTAPHIVANLMNRGPFFAFALKVKFWKTPRPLGGQKGKNQNFSKSAKKAILALFLHFSLPKFFIKIESLRKVWTWFYVADEEFERSPMSVVWSAAEPERVGESNSEERIAATRLQNSVAVIHR